MTLCPFPDKAEKEGVYMKSSIRRIPLVLFGIALFLLVSGTLAGSQDSPVIKPQGKLGINDIVSGVPSAPDGACVQLSIFDPNKTVIDVPEVCDGGMCKILVDQDGVMGAFGPGFLWPVFYQQDAKDDTWIGGPSLSLAGVSFSKGRGKNGDSQQEFVFLGGLSGEDQFVAIYDDSDLENSPEKWTIEIKPDDRLTGVNLYFCGLTILSETVTKSGSSEIPVPDFCIDSMCGIMLSTDGKMGAFDPGLTMPVHYQQSSSQGWIAGPNVSLAGVSFSDGYGINGDSQSSAIFKGNYGVETGYAALFDDSGIEMDANKWSVEFEPGSDLNYVTFYIYELSCEKHEVGKEGKSPIIVPEYCRDYGICQILADYYLGGTMGAFGNGMSWPVHYSQDNGAGKWGGGPNLSIAGVSFSAGRGKNGDEISDYVLLGGDTSEGGYARLYDDSSLENSKSLWTIDFNPDEILTWVDYYTCEWNCSWHPVPVYQPSIHLPLVVWE
jgi:hypothetical protein